MNEKLIDFREISSLLKSVKILKAHQYELKKIKGETFNIFSILGVENNENKTHSNFLAELLNPKGSHLQGNIFLKLFLELISYEGTLDLTTVEVFKEYYIGTKTKYEGGRIDILIKDLNNNTISIENKIYAGDQENQLIRYNNFNKSKNKVYYLTLFGNDASDYSIKDEEVLSPENEYKLESGIDYFTLSYSFDILKWLNLCHEKSVNIPQLRESIKQYILLIEKLTNQNMDERDKMIDLLFSHHEAASKIASEFDNLRNHIRWKFREDIVSKLKQKLDNTKFEIKTPNAIHKKPIAQIFIHNKTIGLKEFELEILIESFNDNGHHNGNVFIGILDFKSKFKDFPIITVDEGFNKDYWKSAKFILNGEENINFRDNIFLNKIKNPKSANYNILLNSFVNQCTVFIHKANTIIEEYFELKKKKIK